MRVFLYVFLLFSAGLWNACRFNHSRDELAEPQQFTDVIVDILVYKQIKNQYSRRVDSLNADWMEMILRRHGLDSVTFYRTMEFYAEDPGQFREIYMQVEKKLKQKLDSVDQSVRQKKSPRPKVNPAKKVNKIVVKKKKSQ